MGRATNGWQSHSSDKKRRHGEQARQMFQHNVSLLLQKALRRSATLLPSQGSDQAELWRKKDSLLRSVTILSLPLDQGSAF